MDKCELFTAKGRPGRDPRGHTVSMVYIFEISDKEKKPELKSGDDASTAKFYKLKSALKHPGAFAFDHHDILL